MQESWVEGHRSISGGVLWIHSCCGHGRFPCDSYELVGIYPRFKNEFLWCRCRRISRTRGYRSGPFQGGDLHSQVQDGGDKLWIKEPFKLSQSVEEIFERDHTLSSPEELGTYLLRLGNRYRCKGWAVQLLNTVYSSINLILARDKVDKEGGIVPHQKEGELLEEMTHFFLLLLTRRCFDAEKRKPKVAPGSCCSGFTQGDTKVGLTW